LVEHQTVQISSPRFQRRTVLLGLAVSAALLGTVSPAYAVVPPDISGTYLSCIDAGGGTLRPGDDVACTLHVSLAFESESAVITAVAPLPASLGDPTSGSHSGYDEATRTIGFNASALGFMFPGSNRVGEFHVPLADVPAGTSIVPTVDVVATGTDDGAVTPLHLTALTALVVDPPPPDLSPSSIECTDVDGGELLPADELSCDLTVSNAPDREDAAGVGASFGVLGAGWLSGGTSHVGVFAFFDDSAAGIGLVPAGTTRVVNAHFQVPPSALGGKLLLPFSTLSGSGTESGALTQDVSGSTLTVAPGPADLTASTLVCADSNGGHVLAGDDLRCTLTVLPSAGHQGVSGATATVPIPATTDAGAGGDSVGDGTITFAPSLGDIPAGSSKSPQFHLRIKSTTPTGTVIAPAAAVMATSVPAGTVVTRNLKAPGLTVGELAPVADGAIPVGDPVVVVPGATTTPSAAVAKSYKLKAKTIRIKLRRGQGRRRGFVYVKKFVTRTPKTTGKLVVKKVTVPKKGKYAPKRGKVKIKGTRLTYTLPKGKQAKDRFHYTVIDPSGKKTTGFVIISRQKAKKR
jgi:hypothetical protein